MCCIISTSFLISWFLNAELSGNSKLCFYLLSTWHLKSFNVTLKIIRNVPVTDSGRDHEKWQNHILRTLTVLHSCMVLHAEMWKSLHLSSKLSIYNHALFTPLYCSWTLPPFPAAGAGSLSKAGYWEHQHSPCSWFLCNAACQAEAAVQKKADLLMCSTKDKSVTYKYSDEWNVQLPF